MARNEEKHFCNLNRLILLKEREEYERVHPPRPRLNSLDTPEDIQKWLPSIKRDIDFYLKKSQVTCYSDAHVEECREKVVKLEKEFKAFVRKIKQLTPSPLDVIPWTSRPYKRKKTNKNEETSFKEFKHIATPILDDEKNNSVIEPKEDNIISSILYSEENNSLSVPIDNSVSQYNRVNWNLMDQPLIFTTVTTDQKKLEDTTEKNANFIISILKAKCNNFEDNGKNQDESLKRPTQVKAPLFSETSQYEKSNQTVHRIVNYDSSDDEKS